MSLALRESPKRYVFSGILVLVIFTVMFASQPAQAATSSSDAWAGYFTARGSYTKVNMYFTVPTLTATKGRTTAVYIWAGLQGDRHLVQAGIDSIVDSHGNQRDFAWWFICCGGAGGSTRVPDMGLAMKPGDKIWVYVSSNADGSGRDEFLIENLTQRAYKTHYEYGPDTFAGNKPSASCVVERQRGVIANFGTLSVTGCGTYINGQGGMAPIGSFPSRGEDMVGGNTMLVRTGPLTYGSNFELTWANTGIGLP